MSDLGAPQPTTLKANDISTLTAKTPFQPATYEQSVGHHPKSLSGNDFYRIGCRLVTTRWAGQLDPRPEYVVSAHDLEAAARRAWYALCHAVDYLREEREVAWRTRGDYAAVSDRYWLAERQQRACGAFLDRLMERGEAIRPLQRKKDPESPPGQFNSQCHAPVMPRPAPDANCLQPACLPEYLLDQP